MNFRFFVIEANIKTLPLSNLLPSFSWQTANTRTETMQKLNWLNAFSSNHSCLTWVLDLIAWWKEVQPAQNDETMVLIVSMMSDNVHLEKYHSTLTFIGPNAKYSSFSLNLLSF